MKKPIILTLSLAATVLSSCQRSYNQQADVLGTPPPRTNVVPSTEMDPLTAGMAAGTDADPNQIILFNTELTASCLLKKGVLYSLEEAARPVLAGRTDLTAVSLTENPRSADPSNCSIRIGYVKSELFAFSEAPPKCDLFPASSEPEVTNLSLDGSGTPAEITNWLAAYSKCVDKVSYVYGASSCKTGADCSGSIVATNQRLGLPMKGTQPDLDKTNFVSCKAGDYKPGDHLLLGYNCASPDHWVTLANVVDAKIGNSPKNTIVDQSTDCAPCCKPGKVRPNLARRAVCACSRHKSFDKLWK